MIKAHPQAEEYTALSDRMSYLLLLRLGMAIVVLAWAAIRPEVLGTSLAELIGITTGYLAMACLAEWARRRLGRFGLPLLSAMLLIDGLYLAYAMYMTGATQSPIRFLIYLHLVAVSLLASYRTGLKIALWHSLLLFVVLYAQAAQLLAPVDVIPGRGIEFDRMPVLNVTSFWLFALATSIFSAMNERELRQRRADLQALVDVGARLDEVADPVHQARIVLDGLAARFGFTRGLVLGAAEGNLLVLASRGAQDVGRHGPRRRDHQDGLGASQHASGQASRPGAQPVALCDAAGRPQPADLADGCRRATGGRHRGRASVPQHLRRRAACCVSARPVLGGRSAEPAQRGAAAARAEPGGARLADRCRQPPHVPGDAGEDAGRRPRRTATSLPSCSWTWTTSSS